jgi:cell division topological specificity factor
MNLFRFHRPIRSAPVARERLQVLLEYERRVVTQTDPIALMREEILAVVSRYVTVDYDKVQVIVDRGAGLTVAIDLGLSKRDHPPCERRRELAGISVTGGRDVADMTKQQRNF